MSGIAYWRGVPVSYRRIRVRIGSQMPPTYWCARLVGEERDALEIETPEGRVLIDDENGVGWAVVSNLYGSQGGWKRLPPDSEILRELPPIGEADRGADRSGPDDAGGVS